MTSAERQLAALVCYIKALRIRVGILEGHESCERR